MIGTPPLQKFIEHCSRNLVVGVSSAVGRAKDYLTERNISKEDVALHQIGYCHSGEVIPNEIRFSPDKKKDFSFFIHDKLIVPILSEFGKPVGFATRAPTFESGNTWWNTSFKKGNHLFMLDKARQAIFNRNKVYVVEGYADAVVLFSMGLTNVVCIMGTALTFRKIGLIARYSNNICFCLDSDANGSGQKARGRSIVSLRKFSFCENISVIELPIGVDPDEYVIKHGVKQMLSLERVLSDKEIIEVCQKVAVNAHR